jgi:hypothetical protein
LTDALTTALCLFTAQGAVGAFDTLYFHEWRARLPALGLQSRAELRLHAARALIYAVIFGALPRVEWRGAWAAVLAALLFAEIAITLKDFVVEDRVRKPLGGVYAGERVTHAVMGIIYGAALAYLLPLMLSWWREPTSLAAHAEPVAQILTLTLTLMSAGVAASGARDLYAALGLPNGGWPWRVSERGQQAS